MIGLSIGYNFLELEANASVTLEIQNPFFNNEAVPGTVSFPMSAPVHPVNQKLLQFPELVAATSRKQVFEDARIWVKGLLWKRGTLKLRPSTDRRYNFNLLTDAGEIMEAFRGKRLDELDLGTDTLNYNVVGGTYPTYNYALFPVLNTLFYGDKNPDFLGYLNYYRNGGFRANSTVNQYALVPFPYLAYLLTKLFENIGFTVTGDWIASPEISRVCVFNNYALDALTGNLNTYASAIDFRNHVPEMTVGKFLVAVQNFFAVAYCFDPIKKQVKITPYSEAVNSSLVKDMTHKVSDNYGWQPSDYRGYTLQQRLDGQDDLTEELDSEWAEKRLDDGEQPIATDASAMFDYTGADSITPSRQWRVPYLKQPGSSTEFGLGIFRHSLRFVNYLGMQNGSDGQAYPMGSWGTQNFLGGGVPGAMGLRWDDGLYSSQWQDWLDFTSKGEQYPREVRLDITDLLSLNPARKWVIDYHRYLWRKIRVTVDNKTGIRPAQVDLVKVNV